MYFFVLHILFILIIILFLFHSCVHCKQPRSKDPRHAYCTHCGSRFAPLPKTSPKPPLQMAVCSGCRAHLPLNSSKCLVCEGSVLKPLPIPTITGQIDHIHQCKVHMQSIYTICYINRNIIISHLALPHNTHNENCDYFKSISHSGFFSICDAYGMNSLVPNIEILRMKRGVLNFVATCIYQNLIFASLG